MLTHSLMTENSALASVRGVPGGGRVATRPGAMRAPLTKVPLALPQVLHGERGVTLDAEPAVGRG